MRLVQLEHPVGIPRSLVFPLLLAEPPFAFAMIADLPDSVVVSLKKSHEPPWQRLTGTAHRLKRCAYASIVPNGEIVPSLSKRWT